MSLPSSYLRPELAALAPYNAGLTVAEVASRPGVTRVAKLGSNENPLGPDPAVRQALEAALQRIAVYPDPVGRTLVAKLAARHGIAAPTLVGTTSLGGRLYDFGAYPGMVFPRADERGAYEHRGRLTGKMREVRDPSLCGFHDAWLLQRGEAPGYSQVVVSGRPAV